MKKIKDENDNWIGVFFFVFMGRCYFVFIITYQIFIIVFSLCHPYACHRFDQIILNLDEELWL